MDSSDQGYVMASVDTVKIIDAFGALEREAVDQFGQGLNVQVTAGQTAVDEDAPSPDICCIATMGTKGSGKSTLLNELFGCSFPLGTKYGRGMPGGVNGGVWSSLGNSMLVAGQRPLVFLDAQGFGPGNVNIGASNGATSAQDQASAMAMSEKNMGSYISFALAMADVILFSVYCSDLGRYEAAGYSQLRTLFNEYSRMFQRDDARKTALVFVVRDHDDGSSVDSLMSIIIADCNSIWNTVCKPDAYKTCSLNDLFEIRIFTLPHYKFRNQEFTDKLGKLRAILTEGDLLKVDFSKTVPSEAFSTYTDVVWKDLSDERTITLPGQRTLIASYRCETAHSKQYKNIMHKFSHWYSQTERGALVGGFGKQVERLISHALSEYDAETRLFTNSSTYVFKRTQLQRLILQNARSVFNKQLLLLQNKSLQRFKGMLVSRISTTGVVPQADQDASLKTVDQWFTKRAEELLISSVPDLNYRAARIEVQGVLQDFAAKFQESPTVQLQSLQRLQREANKPPKKDRNIGVGLLLTGVMRPSGYGNFQTVATYAKFGHRVNFSCINDADAAEQEGQGKVPYLRVQPSLNVDLNV